jgi:DNA processing protein
MDMGDNLYWLWMSLKLGPANDNFVNLMSKADSPYDLYRMDADELAQLTDDDDTVRKLSDKRLNEAADIMDYCIMRSIGILSYADPKYPERLKTLYNPPIVLYYRGKLPDFDRHLCIGVVGTRKMSEYGQHTAYRMAYELAGCGVVVVSGMALGIDGVATCAAIESGGTVVAVLGCGVDRVYPKAHARLMDAVMQHGVVISEYPPGTEPFGHNFPVRNRIISGLCQGTVVVEADLHSGALITAEHAIMQGRQLFVLPGNVGEDNTAGTNQYLKDGANIALGAEDVVRYYDHPLLKPRVNYTALHYMQKQTDIHETESLEHYGVKARQYDPRKKDDAMDTSTFRPFRKPKVETAILIDTEEKPRFTSTTTKPKKRALKPVENPQPDPVESKLETAQPSSTSTAKGDGSSEIVASLDEKTRRVFDAIPSDRSISLDKLMALGYKVNELIAATTFLEIKGLINSLPGSLYIRK